MKVGTLGSIAFYVGPDAIKTIRDFSRSSKASISQHAIHNRRSLAEFTGSEADPIKFKLKLSKNLGVDPRADYSYLLTCLRTGKTIPFTMGKLVIGEYRWLVKELKATAEDYDKNGNITERDVEVSLLEYLR